MTSLRLKALRRIVHVATEPQVDPTASAESAEICSALRAGGADVHLAVVADRSAEGRPPWIHGFPAGQGPRWLSGSSRMHQWLRTSAGTGETGMLHSHGLWSMPCVYPGWVSKWNWTPYVASIRGMLAPEAFERHCGIGGAFWRFVQRPALEAATCLHVDSEAEIGQIRVHGILKPVAVIPTRKTQAPLRSRDGRSTPSPQIVWVAGSGSEHALRHALEAWAELGALTEPWEFRIAVSEGARLPDALPPRTIHFDARGRALADFLGDAAACMVPTDGISNCRLDESLAAGIATIAIGRSEPRMAEDGIRGFAGAAIDGTVNSMLASLAEIVRTDLATLAARGASARTASDAACSTPGVAERILALYDWIISGMPEDQRPHWVSLASRPDQGPPEADQ